jgi:hypothetical protein
VFHTNKFVYRRNMFVAGKTETTWTNLRYNFGEENVDPLGITSRAPKLRLILSKVGTLHNLKDARG